MVARAIWRRLPVTFRRRLAHGSLRLLAPRLPAASPASAAADAPVIIVGFLTSASGLGQAARLAYRAFERQGRAVYGVDLSRFFFETADVVRFAFHDGRAHRGPGRVLININAPYMAYAFNLLGRAFLREKHVTGYWAWELPRAPEAWREGFERTHDIAAPSAFVAEAIRALGDTPPVYVAPHPVMLEELPPLTPRSAPVSEEAPFTIVSAFNAASGFERKNPLALIAAFKRAFPAREDVRLRLLASNIEHYEAGRAALEAAIAGDARIEAHYQAMDRPAYWRWYGTPDLYASLHRAEGFGLTLAEAMALGVPVLATHWSANAEFMDESNALPVRFKLAAIADDQQKYAAEGAWAEADVEHAAVLMQRAYAEPEWLAKLARAGQAHAARIFETFDPWG